MRNKALCNSITIIIIIRTTICSACKFITRVWLQHKVISKTLPSKFLHWAFCVVTKAKADLTQMSNILNKSITIISIRKIKIITIISIVTSATSLALCLVDGDRCYRYAKKNGQSFRKRVGKKVRKNVFKREESGTFILFIHFLFFYLGGWGEGWEGEWICTL